jgi:hypothetical protein
VRDCGRPAYARGLCQTHHRHVLEGKEPVPIRPYRPRAPNTIKFSGLRLTRSCAEKLAGFAQARRISRGAAIAEILEQWHSQAHSWSVA